MVVEKVDGNHRIFIPQHQRSVVDTDELAQQSSSIEQSVLGENQRYILVNNVGGRTYATAQGAATIDPTGHTQE